MKKYFVLAASAAVVLGSSCSNEEISEVSALPENGKKAIEISAYTPGLTRYLASEATIGNLVYDASENKGGFSLTGVYEVDNELKYIENMNEALCTVDTLNGNSCSLVDGKIVMWPTGVTSDTQFSFYAYCPAGSDNVSLNEENGTLTVSYIDGETDVMAASNTATAGNPVALGFKHLLAQVVLDVQYDSVYVKKLGDVSGTQLTSLSLSAPSTSSYDFVDNAITADPETLSVYTFVEGAVSLLDEFGDAPSGIAMIPAAGNDGTTCELSVAYNFQLSNGQELQYTKKANVKIIAGYKNVINVTVKGDTPISITATVGEWETAEDQDLTLY